MQSDLGSYCLHVVLVWVGDTAAYFVGRGIGRWKMAPHISPKKTWEGSGQLLGALLVAAVFGYWAMGIPPAHMLPWRRLAISAGQIGDLFESAGNAAPASRIPVQFCRVTAECLTASTPSSWRLRQSGTISSGPF